MNIVSSVLSGIGIILFSLDFLFAYPYYPDYHYPGYPQEEPYSQYTFWNLCNGLKAVILLLSLLEFSISISVAVFSCKATCYTDPVALPVTYLQVAQNLAPNANLASNVYVVPHVYTTPNSSLPTSNVGTPNATNPDPPSYNQTANPDPPSYNQTTFK
ncbi:membrane-spanning 4-domains subfamily A member 8-like [Latimeria chalumnae]|uniref:membrane-spanning 4-domains subfamily A member 8-like n=1 Tax=Latimeria chalumnae TaxID=7897 RepID=UPI0003C0FFCE